MTKPIESSKRRGPTGGLLLAVAAGAFAWSACGPVTASSTISDAADDLDEARKLEAEQNAPYEFTRAETFLHKARELEGYGLFEQAADYARQSRLASEKAMDVARLAGDRERRKERFEPKGKRDRGEGDDDAPRKPGFTPSGEGD